MRKLLLVFLVFLAGCSGCAHLRTPECQDVDNDFAKAHNGWVQMPPMIGDTFTLMAFANPETLEVEGRVFISPEDPDYSKEGLEKEIPGGEDRGYCKSQDKDLRVIDLKDKMDPNAGVTEA